MKNQLLRYVLSGLMLAAMISCSRQDPAPAPATEPLADTQWYGTFAYPGESIVRVFTIRLSAKNDFVWQDISGSYSGKWSRTGDDVTITFTLNGIQTTFALVGNNRLTNPKNLNHSAWTITQLNRIESEDALNIGKILPNSRWQGNMQLVFDMTKLNKLAFNPNGGSYRGSGEYTTSGPVIQIDNAVLDAAFYMTFFGVFISENTLIGNFTQRVTGATTTRIWSMEELTRK